MPIYLLKQWIRFVRFLGWCGTRHISTTYDRLYTGNLERNPEVAAEFLRLRDAWAKAELSLL